MPTVTGQVRCTTGEWVLKQNNACVLPGKGTTGDGGSTWELIQGNKKQYQSLVKLGTYNDTCADAGGDETHCEGPNMCNEGGDGCGGWPCDSCISYYDDWGGFLVPYIDYAGPKCNVYKNTQLIYYEWECV